MEGHRRRHQKLKESSRCDVIVAGDSMVKHINGERLSRRNKRVICISKPGAMVKDIASSPCEMLKPGGELIIHAGTNNIVESASSVAHEMAVLYEFVVAEGFLVTISGIIHRRWESADESRRVEEINRLMETAAHQNNWGFIDNPGRIEFILIDLVYVSWRPMSRHIHSLQSTTGQNRATTQRQRSYADVVAGKTGGSSVSEVFTEQKGPQCRSSSTEGLDLHQS